MNFGESLRELRQARGLTQAELAEQIGVSHIYISALERGTKPAPRHAVALSLARCLGIDEEDFWQMARSERETRLRSRVHGQPTSRRLAKRRKTEASADARVEAISPDDAFEKAALQRIEAITSSKKDRKLAIQILEILLDLMK